MKEKTKSSQNCEGNVPKKTNLHHQSLSTKTEISLEKLHWRLKIDKVEKEQEISNMKKIAISKEKLKQRILIISQEILSCHKKLFSNPCIA